MSKVTFTDAFNQYFIQLSLDTFPSGKGDWRNELRYRSDELEEAKLNADVDLFTTESLLELSTLQPFSTDTSWSENVQQLLKESIESPGKLHFIQVCKNFEKLRIIGKNVEVIDKGIKNFTNLQELILSANVISNINGKDLPLSLKVLELCSNRITSLKDFTVDMPPLHYLGLSYNSISSIHDFIQPHVWRNLLVLDLSHNVIDDLLNTMEALKKVEKLRSLSLKGNPVYCLLAYQGVLIDSLNHLTVLDDIGVTADDRLHYKGIHSLQDLSYEEFVIHFHLSKLKGMPVLEQQSNMVVEEYPLNIVKYQIQIRFPVKFTERDRETFLKGGHKNINNSTVHKVEDIIISKDSQLSTTSNDLPTTIDEESYFIRTPEFSITNDEEISMDYEAYIIGQNVKKLYEFLKQPVLIEIIVHHIVVSNEPKPDEDAEDKMNNNLGNDLQAGIAKEKSTKSVDRSKSKMSVGKMNSNESGNKPTKAKGRISKQEPLPLHEWSRVKKVFASYKMDCKSLLEDSGEINEECIFEVDNNIAKELSCSATSEISKRSQDHKKKLSRDMKRGGGSAKSVLPPKNKKNSTGIPHKESCDTTDENLECRLPVTLDCRIDVVKWNSLTDASNYLYGTIEEDE